MNTLTRFTTEAGASATPDAPPREQHGLVTVSMADVQVSDRPDSTLVAYALGSCIGVAIWDRTLKVGGLMHVMLPSSRAGAGAAWVRPAMFADVAVPLLVGRMLQMGSLLEDLVVKLAGGGQLLAESRQMAIGTRNIEAVRAAFASQGVAIAAEDVGGTKSRSLRLEVGTGVTRVCSRGEETAL